MLLFPDFKVTGGNKANVCVCLGGIFILWVNTHNFKFSHKLTVRGVWLVKVVFTCDHKANTLVTSRLTLLYRDLYMTL